MSLVLLIPADRPARSAISRLHLARGGPDCRRLTTAEMLAAIGEAQPTDPAMTATLSTRFSILDRAIALGVAL